MFDNNLILKNMEMLRGPNGTFIASNTNDYRAMWLRDHLYATFAYWYLGDYTKLREGIWTVFDLLKRYQKKIELRIASPIDIPGGILHAKYNPETFDEVTTDEAWGHDQLDTIGLFLHIVADLDFKNIRTIRDNKDLEILQLLVYYARSVEYWQHQDFGMWEECKIRHSSSIGAVLGGLSYLKRRRLVVVPDSLISCGENALDAILPFESRDRCRILHHNHDCDAAQLSLLWPYNVVVNPARCDEILLRIVEGHATENGERHCLTQTHGLNRYWGDDYYRSTEEKHRGISAEWPMFSFWISIIYSQRHDYDRARLWFEEGCKWITNGQIPEAYQNGKPNEHSPLAWAHAISLIAFSKLPHEFKNKLC